MVEKKLAIEVVADIGQLALQLHDLTVEAEEWRGHWTEIAETETPVPQNAAIYGAIWEHLSGATKNYMLNLEIVLRDLHQASIDTYTREK